MIRVWVIRAPTMHEVIMFIVGIGLGVLGYLIWRAL